jgi:hypothetical protein
VSKIKEKEYLIILLLILKSLIAEISLGFCIDFLSKKISGSLKTSALSLSFIRKV